MVFTFGLSSTIVFASETNKVLTGSAPMLMEEIPDFDTLVLIDQNESVKDGVRYVTEVYSSSLTVQASAGNNVDYFAVMRVYDDSTQNGVQLMQMMVGGAFSWNEDADTVRVEKYYQPSATTLTFQTYPIITPKGLESKNDHGGLWGGEKYAYIKYTVDMEKSAGKHITCSLELDVNVKGEKTVKCKPSDIAFQC